MGVGGDPVTWPCLVRFQGGVDLTGFGALFRLLFSSCVNVTFHLYLVSSEAFEAFSVTSP